MENGDAERTPNFRNLLYIGAVFVAVALVYFIIVQIVGYERIGIAIQFGRVAIATAVLIIVAPELLYVFRQSPAPHRDYFFIGFFLVFLSAVGFAVFNVVGKLFDIDTNIFTSPLGGFLSLMLVAGGTFVVVVPDDKHLKASAVGVGLVLALLVTIIAPLFIE